MAKVILENIDELEDQYNLEKFKKRRQSNPNKKHNKKNKNHHKDIIYPD